VVLLIDELKRMISFRVLEEVVVSRFGLPSEAALPLLLSLEYGGDWSIRSSVSAVAVKDKVTYYSGGEGVTVETIYLLVNPVIVEEEGVVARLEKCSLKGYMEAVRRPYRVTVKSEKTVLVHVNPLKKTIEVEEGDETLTFSGGLACRLHHEIEHVRGGGEGRGEPVWTFQVKVREKE